MDHRSWEENVFMSLNIVVMMGPPGVGKGTQGRFLSKIFGAPILSIGDLLRQEVDKKTATGKELQKYIDRGEMAPWILMGEIIAKYLGSLKSNKVIFDGLPRYKSQMKNLEPLLKALNAKIIQCILLTAKDDVVLERLLHRRQCASCGMPKEKDGDLVCSFCGSTEFVFRADDEENVIRHRLNIYHRDSQPLIDYFDDLNLLKIFDGEKPVEDIQGQLIDILSQKGWVPLSS